METQRINILGTGLAIGGLAGGVCVAAGLIEDGTAARAAFMLPVFLGLLLLLASIGLPKFSMVPAGQEIEATPISATNRILQTIAIVIAITIGLKMLVMLGLVSGALVIPVIRVIVIVSIVVACVIVGTDKARRR